MEGYRGGMGRGQRIGEKVQGIRSVIGSIHNRQGEVRNSMGNGEAKELICMTHGHKLKWGNDGGMGITGWRGIKRREKWDNCNSIINKIYFKNKQ